MDVSIIIVNYNTCRLLQNCLASIYKHTKDIDFEVIIVDNASFDNSYLVTISKFPNVIWVDAGENLGFGKANNLGVKYAKGEYLFFLNSDTILLNNAIELFWTYIRLHKNEKIGVLGSVLLDKEGYVNKSFGFFPSPKNEIRYLLSKIWYKYKKQKINDELDIDYVIGADMFICKDVYLDFGGFDPYFFMYYEETDLQYRMAKMGFIRRIILGPQIIHLEGGSFEDKGLTYKRFIMAQKSYNYYLRKHYKGVTYFAYKIIICFIRLTLFFTTKWTLSEKWKGYKTVLLNK